MNLRTDILFYVQHLLGIGHLRRAALIARALDKAGLEVAFVSGGQPVPDLDIGGARLIQLPPLKTADTAFSGLVDEHGRPIDDTFRGARKDRLLEVFHAERPRLLLVEMFPFGRRKLRFELLPLLEAAHGRSPRPQVVCSTRDVVNPIRKPEKTAWILDTLTRYFDRVLVHGDPSFLPFESSFPEAAALGRLIEYTGYVVSPARTDQGPGEGSGEVLVSTGGGAVAEPLLAAALAAAPLVTKHRGPWRILAGPNLPEDRFRDLRAAAPAAVVVERARSDFTALLGRCRLSVSQAGYNTVMEVLAAGCPAVAVPFAAGGEREQSIRASLLAEQGLLTVVDEDGLNGSRLARAIDATLDQAGAVRSVRPPLAMDGADETADNLTQLLAILAP